MHRLFISGEWANYLILEKQQMSTYFIGTRNIGADTEYKVFPQGNGDSKKLLRLNVRFDNPVPCKEGYQDRGGFWAPVEIWHPDAEQWCALYQKGMRILVQGRIVCQEWDDKETGEHRSIFKVEARDIGILPYRVVNVSIEPKSEQGLGEQSLVAPE